MNIDTSNAPTHLLRGDQLQAMWWAQFVTAIAVAFLALCMVIYVGYRCVRWWKRKRAAAELAAAMRTADTKAAKEPTLAEQVAEAVGAAIEPLAQQLAENTAAVADASIQLEAQVERTNRIADEMCALRLTLDQTENRVHDVERKAQDASDMAAGGLLRVPRGSV